MSVPGELPADRIAKASRHGAAARAVQPYESERFVARARATSVTAWRTSGSLASNWSNPVRSRSRAHDMFDKRGLAEELAGAEAYRPRLHVDLDLTRYDEEHELARLSFLDDEELGPCVRNDVSRAHDMFDKRGLAEELAGAEAYRPRLHVDLDLTM